MRCINKGILLLILTASLLVGASVSSLAAPKEDAFRRPIVSAERQEYLQYQGFVARVDAGEQLRVSEKDRYAALHQRFGLAPRREQNPLDNQGGPDAFGYSFVDNVAPDTATYTWIELCGDPDATDGPGDFDDDCSITADIGFSFPFYSAAYTACYPSTNGLIGFAVCNSEYCAEDPATMNPFSPYIAPYWLDQYPVSGEAGSGCNSNGLAPWIRWKTFGSAPNRYFVVEWRRIPQYSYTTSLFSYEAILYENGNVKVQFHTDHQDAGGFTCTVAIGIDAPGAGNGVRYYYTDDTNPLGFAPTPGLAIWYFQPAGTPGPVQDLAGVASGNNVVLTWTDPTTDTNGDPITIDNVQVWLGPVGSGDLLATVNPGVETYTHVGPGDGFHTYNVRAFNDPYYGAPVAVTVLVGASPWEPTDYAWVDISQIGTLLPLGLDEYSSALDIGFDFTHYDQTFTQLWVASHGFVTLNDVGFNGPPFENTAIPNPMDPNNSVYCFWDDNSSETIGAIYYYQDAAEGRFIVSWDGVGHYLTGEQYWFQMILNDNGSIVMNYQTIPFNNSCSIGVEDATGSTGLQVCFNGQGDFLPTEGSAIAFWGGPSGRIEGIVRAFSDNQPIEGILVETMQVPTFAFTDSSGFYSLRLDSGVYSVRFSGSGYCDTTFLNVHVRDDSTTICNATLKSPHADFSVSSISMVTWPGHDVSYPFQITNPAGQCTLDFSISDTSGWLSADPVSGSVPPNGNVTVSAIAHVQGLNPGGDYQSELVITHDASVTPTTIPVSLSISLSSDGDLATLPATYALHPSYPNPFNATTSLRFDLPQEDRVKLVVFNIMGQSVVTVVDGKYPAGRHSMRLDAANLPSGMYLVKLEAGSYRAVQKILLLK